MADLHPNVALTSDSLRECDWHRASDEDSYFGLSQRLRALAKEADGVGKGADSAVLNLLADLCAMGLDADSGKGPFQPFVVMGTRRSLLPEDLDAEQVRALASFSQECSLPLLRARLADVAWLRIKPRAPEYARLAIDAYRATLPTPETWHRGRREEWHRAIALSRELGKDCAERLAEIEGTLLGLVFMDPPLAAGFLRSITELLATTGMGRTRRLEIGQKLESAAIAQEKYPDWQSARELFLQASKWFTGAQDDTAAARATSRAAEAWVHEGELYERSEHSGCMMASSAYEAAVQLLRRVPRKYRDSHRIDERVLELRQRLRAVNERGLDAMEEFTTEPVSLATLADTARRSVSGKDPWPALCALVRVSSPPPPGHWRDQARRSITEFPLQSLFSRSRFARDGRLVARSAGLDFGESGSAAWRKAVEERAIQSLTLYQSLVVQGGILPALSAMSLEHHLVEADFVDLARRSPVVPHGREQVMGRALVAGYRSDFAVSLHLLAPQIEHIVRTHVAAVGGETRTLDESGIESEIGLSALMERPEVEKVFGETLAFELRAIFCDPAGPNLRNAVAHGLLDDDEVFSAPSVYAWWFSLRLVMLPLLPKGKAETPATKGEQDQ